MNWRRNSSGLRWNIFQLVLKSSHGHAPQWANGTYLADRLFHTQLFVQNWNHCDMPMISTSSHTFTRRSVKTISWTLSMISGEADSIGRPERGTSHVDVRPRLNLFTQLYSRKRWCRCAMNLWTLSNSALISFGVKLFTCRCLITSRNSFFSILQKNKDSMDALIYRNETTRWIPLKIWQ